MRKRTLSVLLVLTVAALVAVVLGIASSWYTNWNVQSWFNYWWQGAPKTAVVAPDFNNSESSSFSATRNVGLLHDSDDAIFVADIQQCGSLTYYGCDSETIFYRLQSVSVKATTCDVYVSLLEPHSYGCFATNRTLLYSDITIPNVRQSGGFVGPYISDNVEIKVTDIVNKFSELFNDHYPIVRIGVISKRDGYLDSDESTIDVYVGGNFSFDFEGDTAIKFIGVEGPTSSNMSADEGVFSYFGCSVNIRVGKLDGNNISDADIYDGTVNSATCFTRSEDTGVDTITCDLTKLSFVDTIGDYAYKVFSCSIGLVIPGSSTGGPVVYFNDILVLGDYDELLYFSISKLSAPTNIRMENATLVWDVVSGAEGYAVFDGDNVWSWTVAEPKFELSGKGLDIGEHTFRIRALGNVGSVLAVSDSALMTAYNVNSVISPCVVLTYNISGDTITKFVPINSSMSNYLYDVEMPNKEFGGWFYDTGYSVAVKSEDIVNKDMTIYARLSDIVVTERPLTWWEQNKWYVLIPCLAVGFVIMVVAVVVVAVRKKRNG